MTQSGPKLKLSTAELEARTTELTSEAFKMFCNDIGSMLGCDVAGSKKNRQKVTLADLKNQFNRLVAVTSVKATGTLNGNFYFIFGQEAFFTLAGTLVMLPDKVISQNRTEGTLQSAMIMSDAVGEIGNLTVGAWDRVFRTEFMGKSHFKLSKNFVGNPWNNPEETIELTMASKLQMISYEIAVKDFSPAICAVIYPRDLFEKNPDDAQKENVNKDDVDADEESIEAENKTISSHESANESTIQPHSNENANNENSARAGEVSESIRKITSSTAVLPGESETALGIKSAENIMRKDCLWATPEQTVEYAFSLMKENNADYVLIGQNGVLEGIVSKSDIRGAMSPYLQERFAKWRSRLDMATLQIRLKWVMNKPPAGITPDASLIALAKRMNQQKIKMLPVINSKGSVMGVVTAFELLGAFSNLS